jgi:hypothetical protein
LNRHLPAKVQADYQIIFRIYISFITASTMTEEVIKQNFIEYARVQLINSDFYSIMNIKLLWYNKHEVTLEEEIERILDRMEFCENEEDEYDSENEEQFNEENCFKRPDEEY